MIETDGADVERSSQAVREGVFIQLPQARN